MGSIQDTELEDAVGTALENDPFPVTTLNPARADERGFQKSRPRSRERCATTKQVNGLEVRCIKFRHTSELDCAFPIPAAPKPDEGEGLSLDELAGWTEEAVEAYQNEALALIDKARTFLDTSRQVAKVDMKDLKRLRELVSELGRRALGEE